RTEDCWSKYKTLPERQRGARISASFHTNVARGKDVHDLGKLSCVGYTVCKGEEFRGTSCIAIDPDLEAIFGNGCIERLNNPLIIIENALLISAGRGRTCGAVSSKKRVYADPNH